jgi:cation-transporting P-type ATPase I
MLSVLTDLARDAVALAGEVAVVGTELAATGTRMTAEAVRTTGRTARRIAEAGSGRREQRHRFHLPLHPDPADRSPERAIKKVVAKLLQHPDVLVAYWDSGMARLVVQLTENAVTDRVVEEATVVADRYGLSAVGDEAEDVPQPGDVRDVQIAVAALAMDAAGFTTAVAAKVLRLRRPPQVVAAALTVLREDPRLRALLRSRLGRTPAELITAAANAAVHGIGQSPTALLLDGALRAGQLAEAVARVAAFDATQERLCVPKRTHMRRTAPVRRPAPVDPVHDYAAKATIGGVVGAAATLLFTRDLGEASAAVLAGSPKPARYGWTAYESGLGCALAREGVLVRDPERLRLLQMVDTLVMHSSALRGTGRTVREANPNVDEWSRERLWEAAESALHATEAELHLRPVPDNPESATSLMVASAHGCDVGTVLIGREADPLAEAVLDAARIAGLRVVIVDDPALGDCTAAADEVVDPERKLADVVSRMQDDGHTVLTVARLAKTADDEVTPLDADLVAGVLRGDLAVTLADNGSAEVWASDLVCVYGLPGLWRLLTAVPAARKVGTHANTYAKASAALSGLLVLTGRQRRWADLARPLARVSPVDLASGAAMLSGWRFALGVAASSAPVPRLQVPWHALTPDQVMRRLARDSRQAARAGAGVVERTRELAARLGELAGVGLMSLSLRLADAVRAELNDPLTPILVVGAAASAVLGSTVDAGLVLGAMGVNALVGGVQRLRAEHALAAVAATQKQKARRVQRNRHHAEIVDAAKLAPGDVIELTVGDVVPADARLLDVHDLEVDQSALTGESLPVTKQLAASPATSITDRRSIVFEGTTVVAGEAKAVVVDIGDHTESGRATALASRAPPAAGVQARLRELTSKALPLTFVGGAAVTGLSLLRGRTIREAVSGGVAVAVAAVPEGLPLVATVAQMAAARRLSSRGILVRAARTLEALGRVDTVCFDKTGTLTENRLRVVRVSTADGTEYSATDPDAATVLRIAARACPRNGHDTGKPAHATDEAVLAAAPPDPDWAQVAGQPFEASRGYAAATGAQGDSALLVVKGAPEVVLPACRSTGPGVDDSAKTLACKGLRVLAVAQRRVSEDDAPDVADKPLQELEFVGFLAFADSPRSSAAPLVTGLRACGVDPVMLTGDHPQTALAVATTLGWPEDTTVVTGEELAAMDRAGRARVLREAGVVARVAPEQKLDVIEALRAADRVVAMVGDGANDAAAIRAADVGIGIAARGSAAARNAADLVLTDDDLTVLVDAVAEGRALWSSVADAISILIGGNAGEVGFTVLGTLLSGTSPLSTRQLLLVNLLTDMFPAMAVAVTPTDSTTQAGDSPGTTRPVGSTVLDAPLTRQIRERGILTGLGAGTAWLIGGLTPGTARRTSTMALCGLVGSQLAQTLTGRGHSPLVIATSLGSAAVLFGIVQTPGLSHFFGCTPLGPVAWTGVAAGVGTAALGSWLCPPVERFAGTAFTGIWSPESG